MILGRVENFSQYVALNPGFLLVEQFMQQHSLDALEPGRYDIAGEDVFVSIVDLQPKSREEACLETHNAMIDVQVVITGQEEHGFTPRVQLPEAAYDAKNDISFYPGKAQQYFTLTTNDLAVYFPEDGHAPAISKGGVRKAIFKVKR